MRAFIVKTAVAGLAVIGMTACVQTEGVSENAKAKTDISLPASETVEANSKVTDGWPMPAAPVSTEFHMPAGDTGYYSPPASEGMSVNLVIDFNATADGSTDDSQSLQKAINKVSRAGGGRVLIPKGRYVFSGIKMQSNVRILIEAGSVIMPIKELAKGSKKGKNGSLKKIVMFDFGSKGKVENVSVEGLGGRYDINLHTYTQGIIVFAMKNVENFKLSNVNVNDTLTKFSAITMGPSDANDSNRGMPTNGHVTNISQTGAHYGYGVVQTQAAQNVLFEHLSGVGGAVVRWETGYKGVNDQQYGGIGNLMARNIDCKDGNAAVMISPHAMHNGIVVAEDIRSDGCGFAVRIGNGYVAKKYSNPNLEAGSFVAGTRVSNIYAKYGENAQLKRKHYKYMPETLLSKILSDSEDGESHRGPSIAPVINIANYPMEIGSIVSEGFSQTPDIVVTPAPRSQ